MEIKKNFKDIGSITKALLRHIDLTRVYIKICMDPGYPGQTCVALMPYGGNFPIVFYTWTPGKVQTINIPDDVCLTHVLQKKVRVQTAFKQNRPY